MENILSKTMNEDRNVKQVIVFRKDLLKGENAIRKGKFAAQCCHASIGSLLTLFEVKDGDKDNNDNIRNFYHLGVEKESYLDKWLNGIFTKICLSVNSDEELVALYENIKNENPNIPCVLITDCGLTEFHGVPTNTCIGIGPYWSDEIDKFTSELKLL